MRHRRAEAERETERDRDKRVRDKREIQRETRGKNRHFQSIDR